MMLHKSAPRACRTNGSSRDLSSSRLRTSAWRFGGQGSRDADSAGPLAQAGSVLSAALLAAGVLLSPAVPAAQAAADVAPAAADTVYFGNGCFWGRQKDFVDAEKALGRTSPEEISALVGYAGGVKTGPQGKVCYYYSDPRTIYEKLGHAEVVQVALKGADEARQQEEFRRFADTYFSEFQRLRNGKMQRLDPQDFGAGYRNVVGLPGGVNSPLFKVLLEANVNGMELREGRGNGGPQREGDEVGVVWVVDSNDLGFHRAENYHQFHTGLGFESFPPSYTRDLKKAVAATGRIDPTGCPELPF